MKIVVIDNYDSFVYNIVRYLNESFEGKVTVMRNDEIDANALEESDGILLSPGPGIPTNAGQLMSVIETFHKTKPILGVCLGHQAIAEFFGGNLVQDKSPSHGKSSPMHHNGESSLFQGIPETSQVGRYHSWCVAHNLPPALKETARSIDDKIMALEHCSLNIKGVQFHPESIMTPYGRKMISNWIQTIKH